MGTTQYIMLDRTLLRDGPKFGLSLDAMLLYSLLRDRCTLSARNGWVSTDGRVFLTCARESAAQMLHCSLRKSVELFALLVDAGLLVEERPNASGCKHLYLRQWCSPSAYHPVEELRAGGFRWITAENVRTLPEDYVTLDAAILAREDISSRAKVLYALAADACDGASLYGRDSASLPRSEMLELLCCSNNSLSKAYAELEAAGLIVRGAKGFGSSRAVSANCANSAPQLPKSCTSTAQNRHLQLPKICTRTNPPYPTSNSQLLPTSLRANAWEAAEPKGNEIIFSEIANDVSRLSGDTALAEEVVAAIADVYHGDLVSGKSRRVSNTLVPPDEVSATYRSIDRFIMDTLAMKILENWGRVRDKQQYIRASLLSAGKHEGESFFVRQRLTA